MASRDVLIVGVGSLTRAICSSLATTAAEPCVVTLLSGTPHNAAEVCYVANTRAALSGTDVVFRALPAPEYSAEVFRSVLARVKPAVVVNCASHQSPWEGTRAPSAWSDLVARAGFGVTLPLQSLPALTLAEAIADVHPQALLVNACFPDAVNPVLKSLGLPVFCGTGNVMTIAASLRAALQAGGGQGSLRVLGHHVHLHPPHRPDEEALAWLDGVPVPDVTETLRAQRGTPRSELNAVGGHATALLVSGLLDRREARVNLPGPSGLPGGYPVRISSGRIRLDLPSGMSRERAVELNQRWAVLDGVQIRPDGEIRFTAEGDAETDKELPDLLSPFHADGIRERCARMLLLRTRLRNVPSRSAA
ncbi:MAG: potassium transporter TrkA [Streptomyces sp.]|nr:potassium transporter TrkA [Streptomyces sp.]NUT29481.1 potassium transporter TrkA [Streptomyces sp.]